MGRCHAGRLRTGAIAAVALLVAAGAAVAAAPAPAGGAAQVRLDEYPRHDPDELPARYRRWLQEEVYWIITKEEREVFLRLDSDAQRDRFIEEFWRQRDPTPGTDKNEYRELIYERIAYANHNFGRETPLPGWRTDRGRVWILLGKPQSLTRLPNTAQAVPTEVWFYSVDPAIGLPPFFYLIFFRDRGIGEYRLYSPAIDGPTKLLNAASQQQIARGGGDIASRGFGFDEDTRAIRMLQQIDPELGNAAASLIPGEGGLTTVSPLRSEMLLARVFDLPNRLMPRATWAYRVLTGVTEADVRFETLPIEATAAVFIDEFGVPFVHYATRTQGDRLNLNRYEDKFYLTFSVTASLHDEQLRFIEPGEPKTLQADLDDDTARRLRGGPVEYIDRVPAIPGRYTFGLVLENNVSREFGRVEFELEVPDARERSLWASEPVLVLESEQVDDRAYDPYAGSYPFQIGTQLFVPAVYGPFPSSGRAVVLRQIRVPATRVEPLLLRYRVLSAAGERLIDKIVALDPGEADEHGLLTSVVPIELAGLGAGEYRLEAELVGEAGTRRVLPLRVQEQDAWVRPFVHALRQPPSVSSEVRLVRAQQLRTAGRTDEAIAELEAVLAREPDRADALALQLDLLTDAGRYGRIAELLAPRLVRAPNDVDLLLRMADAKAKLAEHYDAIRFYERARLAGAEETPELLNALASEYYAEGRFDRVRALLERSLELRPDQPQMRRLLERLPDGGPQQR